MTDIVIRLRRASKLFNPEQHEAASEIEALRGQRDEALRQVAVLREVVEEAMNYCKWSSSMAGQCRQALSETPPVGVLCESEPVAWEYRHADDKEWERVAGRNPLYTAENELADLRTYIQQGYRYELRALYRKKGESP